VIPPGVDQRVNADFVHRLLVAHSSRSCELAVARRWSPGDVDRHVLALVGPVSPLHYFSFATTAKLFAVWHQGRSAASRGFPEDGIGRWAQQLGVGDPKVQRRLDRIINADNDNELAAALTALAAKRTRRSPHWESVLRELLRWSDPSARVATRFDWASDFYRYLPNPTEETA
jgi:CRISPR-associated protein Cse2 (CRISPR_cse2)